MAKMKQRLCTKVWWPAIDKEAEAFCRTCHGCQVVGRPNHPEPLHMTELHQRHWQIIAIDFMGAVTDYYSRYLEVSISKKNTADVANSSLEKIFATHGLPYTHFVAESFQKFLIVQSIY